MSVRFRVLALFTVLLIALSVGGAAIAQTDDPDPNNPVQERTPTPEEDEEETPTEEPEEEPTEEEPTEEPEDTPTEEDEETPTEEPDETATEEVIATPDEATPVATTGPISSANVLLSAMTLDSATIPEEFTLLFEIYTSPEELADNLSGQVDREQLLATGLESYYTSYYVDDDSATTLRTYIISFQTIPGVRAGFNLLEDEENLVPNGSLIDEAVPEGLGEPPGEITSGTIENGDGTQTFTYDVSFRINRFEVGIALESNDEDEIDSDLVDELAVDLANRVTAVLTAEPIAGIEPVLAEQVLELEGEISLEGFETAAEAFQLTDATDAPDGFVSSYFRGASYSTFVEEIYPFAGTTVVRFESAADVENAIEDAETIMPSFPQLEELSRVEIEGADDVVAFSFLVSEDSEEADSVRIFVQVEDTMLIIDVEGADSLDDAETAAITLAEASIECLLDGDCDDPDIFESGVIPTGTL
jgi:hypothetical protein